MTKAELIGCLMTMEACSNYSKVKHYRWGKEFRDPHELAVSLLHAAREEMAIDLLEFYVETE